ncbi:MAG: prolyl oligopeptidase family serine peptidase [Luteimonas sp.]
MKYLLAILLFALPGATLASEIPIQDFVKEAEFTTVVLSPDGKHIAVTIPHSDRSTLVVLGVADNKVIGSWDYGENQYFRQVSWVNNERLLFTTTKKTGQFDFQVGISDMYASNIDGSRRLTIPNGNYYQIVDLTPDDPDTILVTRSIENAFLFKLNINNGHVIKVASSPMDSGSFVVDHAGKVRYAFGEMNDGRQVVYRRDGEQWTRVHESERGGENFMPVGFTADDKLAYVFKGNEGKPESLVLVDPQTEKETAVSSNGTVDAARLLWSSDEKTLLAVRYDDGIPYWDFIAKDNQEALAYAGLVKAFPGKVVDFSGSSSDGRYILMNVYSDKDPGQVYLFDRQTKSAKFLLASMDWIKPAEMSTMKPVSVKTRDGLTIHGYLTIPAGSDGKNLPLIINPHGGPHGIRDDWGFNPEVQLLANRGFAVLQMNYRGSGGYGKAFERAGYRKWGTSMQDDLTDSVRWAIGQGIADGNRVCIYGASYGGYSALMSVVREPDLYKCTVGYVGVYDLDIQRRDSDTSTSEAGRSYLNDVFPPSVAERHAQSPIYGVDRIKSAVMLVHGEKDQRVPIRNMYDLAGKLKAAGKPAEDIVVEKKEAHGFRDVKNQVNLYTRMIAFFDKHIGSKSSAAQTAP